MAPVFGSHTANQGEKPTFKVQRVELNAFSSSGLIAYIEEGLRAHGADEKFFPPEDVADELAVRAQHEVLRTRAASWLAEELDLEGIVEALVEEFGEEPPENLAGVMRRAAEENRAAHWPRTVVTAAEAKVDGEPELRERFEELLEERR